MAYKIESTLSRSASERQAIILAQWNYQSKDDSNLTYKIAVAAKVAQYRHLVG